MDSMVRYASPINPEFYPYLAILLLFVGIGLAAWFFVFEVSRSKIQKDSTIFKELTISFLSSCFLGFGVVFGFLASGIYV